MAITRTDAREVRRALKSAALPTTIEELAEKVNGGHDPAQLAQEIATTAEDVVSKPTSAPLGPPVVAPLPDELLAAADERMRDGGTGCHPEIDRVVTATAGYVSLTERYGLAMSDPATERLAADLANALIAAQNGVDRDAALRAGEYVAYRTQNLVHYLRSSRGPTRDAYKRSLGKITAAANPVAPVAVTPTKYLQRFATIGSLRIRFIDENPTSQNGTILLVHGHGSLLEEYEDLVPLLADRFRVIVPDLPGCGYSSKPDRDYSVKFFAETLIALLDGLGVSHAVVAGGSLGGNLSLRLGLEHAGHFRHLIPWAPAGWIGTDPLLAFGAKLARHMGPWIFWLTYDTQKDSWYSPSWPGRAAALRASDTFRNEIYCETYHRAYFDIAAEQTESTWSHRAKDVAVPTLLMCGPHDDALDMYDTVKNVLATTIPTCEFKDQFSFGRHSLASEDTVQLAGYIDGYL